MRSLTAACVAVAVAVVLSPGALASGVSAGVKLGINQAKADIDISGYSTDTITGVTIGATADIELSRAVTFQTGVQYSQKGTGWEWGGFSGETEVNAVEIPALCLFGLGEAGYAAAGANVGFVTSAENKYLGTTDDIKDMLKSTNVDLVLGAGGAFRAGTGTFRIGVHYELGLTDMNGDPAYWGDGSMKSRNIQILLGYSF